MLEYLLSRLRKRLKSWILEDSSTKNIDLFIDCRMRESGIQRFIITGVHGMRLSGRAEKGSEVRLIGVDEALDQNQFWGLFKHFGGGQGMTWEDGEPFVPPGQ